MKRLLIAGLVALGIAAPAFAGDTYVKSYTRKDGTYVQGHYRSKPDGNPYNNRSTYAPSAPSAYKAPTYTPAPLYAPKPPALRLCNDGTVSSSSGSGTCSWHGGVAD